MLHVCDYYYIIVPMICKGVISLYGIIAQAIGYIGFVIGVFAFQSNKHKTIVLSKAATDVCFGLQYLMLGAYTGALINCIGIVRNLTLANVKDKSRSQRILTVLFVLLITAACIFTWAGPLSILAMVGKICTTISFSIKNTKILRFLTTPSCILWGIYDTLTGAYGAALYELAGLVSIIIAWIRFDVIMKEGR